MKIILSPSKTQSTVNQRLGLDHPKYLKYTKEIIRELKQLNKEEISIMMKLKGKLLDETCLMIKNLKLNPKELTPSIQLYTGVVYESLNINDYDDIELNYLNNSVRIISAMYGVLSPMDGIQNYRLDFTMKLKNIHLTQFWKEIILKEFKNEDLILDCASLEFSHFLNPLKEKVHRVEFIDVVDGQEKIISYNAKKLRGLMANYCIRHQVKSIVEIRLFESDGYHFDPISSNQTTSIFKRISLSQPTQSNSYPQSF